MRLNLNFHYGKQYDLPCDVVHNVPKTKRKLSVMHKRFNYLGYFIRDFETGLVGIKDGH